MKVVARLIEVLRIGGDIEERKDIFDRLELVLPDPAPIVPFKKPFQTPMFELPDHFLIVPCIGTGVQLRR
jgi:hypothetical protein